MESESIQWQNRSCLTGKINNHKDIWKTIGANLKCIYDEAQDNKVNLYEHMICTFFKTLIMEYSLVILLKYLLAVFRSIIISTHVRVL